MNPNNGHVRVARSGLDAEPWALMAPCDYGGHAFAQLSSLPAIVAHLHDFKKYVALSILKAACS